VTTDRLEQLRPRLERIVEMMRGARSELDAARYNNAVNRAYYACFHIGAALRVLRGDAMDPSGRWEHRRTMLRLERILGLDALPSSPGSLSPRVLASLREKADYAVELADGRVTRAEAQRIVEYALFLRETTGALLPWSGVADVDR
jgi:hypothetical protein